MIDRKKALTFPFVLYVLCLPGCEPGTDQTPEPVPVVSEPAARSTIVDFPDGLRVEDDAVNQFVKRAMEVCASGDYEQFRLLWRSQDDPLPNDEYDQGWQAVQRIQIRALRKVFLANEPDPQNPKGAAAYAVLADVSLDATHQAGQNEPLRQVVLLVVKEKGNWRLANATKEVKRWIRDRAESPAEPQQDAP